MKASVVAQSDVGLKRSDNEDSYLIDETSLLFVVADGMGGHAAGNLASRVAVESICDFYRRYSASSADLLPYGSNPDLSDHANKITNAISVANDQIRKIATQSEQLAGMGTTVVCALLNGRVVTIGNVGDSRAYLFRPSGYRQISEDHSWVNEQLRQNLITAEDARAHPWRNVITRALGSREFVEVDIFEERVRGGDQILLCSDGLSGMVDDITMFEIITDSASSQEEKAERLIVEAKKAGGSDNITLVLIRFMEE
ncbi:MAG: Stp1/IreP family PP2C-type Ser/Thr phosphatase [Candidatus Abyssobacteria bacterium SURF_5]|uniref:Stp1/IreP family PP2C-type Ser/Thr phosphatase n=1 Tax=Abyssobacteria bacterium (strain SURF_5) TaxID=2093360 RepID=A0A3A4N5L1_ABYX5|nr:MAG: Stp1/IreP family PP2C-type Ser/Thr phosphatase [Candidatus Abyssubacteria bacterium SURF_5]